MAAATLTPIPNFDPGDQFPCPTCGGQSEVLVSGDPRGDNAETRQCWDCGGEGVVSLAVAEAIEGADESEWEGP